MTPTTAGDRPHTVPGQRRLLAVIEILAGNEVFGRRLKDIAAAVNAGGHRATPATVLRDLYALEADGWAQQQEDQTWRLGAKPMQILSHFQYGLATVRRRVDEMQQRYTRSPA